MNTLKVGFSRVNIDPPLGIGIRGYFIPRYAGAILDSLHIQAIALYDGEELPPAVKEQYDPSTGQYVKTKGSSYEKCILMFSVDNCGIPTSQCDKFRKEIEQAVGVPADRVYIHSIHTHTAPFTEVPEEGRKDEELILEYRGLMSRRFADAARMALVDLKPASVGFAVAPAPERVAYIRRYRMKDGSTMTCPPINDPMISHPIGTLDQRVNVVRFDRTGGDTVVIMNYGLHADTLNLDMISADFPGWVSRTFEAAVPDAKIVTFIGAEGDVGSTHVFPTKSDMNDTQISFDNEMKSPGMCRFVGRALAGAVLQVYDKVEYVDVDSLQILRKTIRIAANVPKKEELPLAHKYKELHEAGKDEEIPYSAMELTTVVAEALRMCRLENGPDYFEFALTGIKIGPIAFLGVPGEPFTEVGRQLKAADGWKMICPTCQTNGKEGYFPTKDAFDEGGYEARASRFKSGVAETVIEGGLALLKDLQEVENK